MNRILLSGLVLGLWTTACRKDEPTEKLRLPADADGDGYAETIDCDDDNPDIFPNAEEVCDGVDNDCDSAVDEDVGFTFYADLDGDLKGDPEAAVQACAPRDGLVEDSSDCDDASAAIYGGAIEVCDGLDNDCDDQIDEDVQTTYYRDADADSYGDDSDMVSACDQPSGYVELGGDCDDSDEARNPGLSEVCDGKDNDCNGDIDTDAIDRTVGWPDGDDDGYGETGSTPLETCVLPSDYVDNEGDCDDTNGAINPDAEEICDALDNDCDEAVDDVDVDLDTFTDAACLDGTDCDDDNPTVYPGAADTWYDGIDSDCGLDDDYDADTDGYVPDTYSGLPTTGIASGTLPGGDCNDTDGSINPGATDTWYDGIDTDCDGADDYDSDSDLYVPDAYVGLPTTGVSGSGALPGNDCDDTDGTINPGVTDTWYDGIDTDCDGVDDYDADSDGYVPDAYSGLTTGGVSGSGALPDGDCDDTDGSINPDATDIWYDGIDQDCDDADDYDADADGFSSDAFSGTDCDDTKAAINPGEVEICDDGIDQNCDGTADSCTFGGDIPVTDADHYFYGENAVDRVGQGDPGVANAGDMDDDGIEDLVVASIFADDTGTNAGVVHLFFGPVSGIGAGVSSSDTKLTGEAAGDLLGRSVVSPGDVDNDGFDDLFLSAQGEATNGANTGAAYLVSGPLTGGTFDVGARATTKFIGAAAGDLIADLAPAGDVDGDGTDDLLISAQFLDGGGTTDGGGAYLLYGPTTTGDYDLGAPAARDARFLGENDDDQAGSSLWGGTDLSGDGVPDIMIAARYYDNGTNADSGVVYVIHGPVSGDFDLGSSDARFTGENNSDELGYGAGVSSAGDVNNDGYEDLIAGARFNDRGGTKSGAAYVVLGPVTTATARSMSSADAIFVGEESSDQTGDSVSGPGDVDGNGTDDLLIGSGWNDTDTTNGGAGYLVLGPVTAGTGVVNLSTADARFVAEGDNDRLRINGGGDLNADGYADILIATQNNSTNTAVGTQHGAVYLFYGLGL
jgi:hypothetical protein